jgi:hypothetical protein
MLDKNLWIQSLAILKYHKKKKTLVDFAHKPAAKVLMTLRGLVTGVDLLAEQTEREQTTLIGSRRHPRNH